MTDAALQVRTAPPDEYGYIDRSIAGSAVVRNETDLPVYVSSVYLWFQSSDGYANFVTLYGPENESRIAPGATATITGADWWPAEAPAPRLTEVDVSDAVFIMDIEGSGYSTYHCPPDLLRVG